MIKNTLEKHFIINGNPVRRYQDKTFLGHVLYVPVNEFDDSALTIYLVKGDKLKGTINAEADMGQGMGYVADMRFDET